MFLYFEGIKLNLKKFHWLHTRVYKRTVRMFVNTEIVLAMGSKEQYGEADHCGALLYKAAPF